MTSVLPIGITRADLAPLDFRSADFDWTGLQVTFVTSTDHPRFEEAYRALWEEFGLRNEMEQRDVIAQRMRWQPETPAAGHALLYEMAIVSRGSELAAVRDHSVMVDLAQPDLPVVTHLSHLLIQPAFRGTGLAGWMRAMPMKTVRDCLSRARQGLRPVVLVAEMEPADPGSVDRTRRLTAYERVGFQKIDPAIIHYLQPDFRTPQQIDASDGPWPVPLTLIVRRVGKENEHVTSGREVRTIVASLYTMYQQTFREKDMAPNWESLKYYPSPDTIIDLVPPTKVIG